MPIFSYSVTKLFMKVHAIYTYKKINLLYFIEAALETARNGSITRMVNVSLNQNHTGDDYVMYHCHYIHEVLIKK